MERNKTFCLGDFQVETGEKKSGYILIGNGEFELPITVLNGKKSGKTVLITAGIHGAEYVGIQSSIELAEHLKIEKIVGTIVIIKVVNRQAFEMRSGSEGFEDGVNLNRIFPGKETGSQMERLAYAIEKELFPCADFYIDLHSGDSYEQLTPYIYYAGIAETDVVEISRKMAEQADVPYMVRSGVAKGGCYNYAACLGIPSVLIERGQMGGWTKEEVHSTRRDVRNILCCLGVYLGQKDYRNYYPLEVTDVSYQAATKMGMWYPYKKPGEMIRQGEVLGVVKDYEGRVLEVSRAEYDGVILYQTGSLQVKEGGPMIAYGKISKESDDRKQKITEYWTKRSDSFQEQRRAELHDDIAQRWLKEILQYVPKKKLKILDVGCGSGFFTILMAQQGHEVIGVDLTADMITRAKELAAEEKADCTFQVMDAENLEFADEAFDMVISRNLTWTLPDAERAYSEWLRVLKKGGCLLNFDANYGISDCSDTSQLPQNHAHNQLGFELLQECEEIKRQLPISSYQRPAWDVGTLGKLGAAELKIDFHVSQRIYIEKDEFYNPDPLFMIYVRKGE
ncbi:MAG: M14 family metallopeptidase [Blautia sp.]|nr:M14 family metallopeptidase [Blautia sp.]